MKLVRLVSLSLALACTAPIVQAAPCVGFVDVDDTHPFCTNVAWMKNRGITSGCTTFAYCPDNGVTRLQMAAFLNRLGTLLTPRLIFKSDTLFDVSLTTPKAICLTDAHTTPNLPLQHPQVAKIDASLYAIWFGSSFSYEINPAFSPDNGVTWYIWGELGAVVTIDQTSGSGSMIGRPLPLEPNRTYRFGLAVERYLGSPNLDGAHCNVRVEVISNDTAVPADAQVARQLH